jgi:hypothetical protein
VLGDVIGTRGGRVAGSPPWLDHHAISSVIIF